VIRVVAFDFDGVVLESNAVKTTAFADLMTGHGDGAARAMARHHRENLGVSRYLKFEWFYRTHLGRAPTRVELAELNERFNALSIEAIIAAPFVPGVLSFLKNHAGRIPLYVVSGTPEPELRRIVTARGLTRYFRDILGTPTGKAEHLLSILKRENVATDEVLMVGDGGTDLRAAVETGVRFYGRGDFKGHHCAEDLCGLADFVAANGAGCPPKPGSKPERRMP